MYFSLEFLLLFYKHRCCKNECKQQLMQNSNYFSHVYHADNSNVIFLNLRTFYSTIKITGYKFYRNCAGILVASTFY